MKIIKRNGTEVEFDKYKIAIAIDKANKSVGEQDRLPDVQILNITDIVTREL